MAILPLIRHEELNFKSVQGCFVECQRALYVAYSQDDMVDHSLSYGCGKNPAPRCRCGSLVCEKTRARLLQSSHFHHLCRRISWESEELDKRPHALFLTAARKSLGSC